MGINDRFVCKTALHEGWHADLTGLNDASLWGNDRLECESNDCRCAAHCLGVLAHRESD